MEKQSLGKLKLWPDNYNEGDIGMIAASIRRFGFNDPPGVWKDNEVRDGNHRVMALRVVKAAGPRPDEDKKWPPQGVTVKGADWFIDWIDLSHLNAQEATAYAIAANRSVELASQDDLRLSMLLQNIAVEDEKLLAATGYGGDDLDELLRFMGKPAEDVGAQVDRAAELQEIWGVEKGDLWIIPSASGDHRLLCGDSTVREDVERVMDGERGQMIFTDPPYGVNYTGGMKPREQLANDNIGSDIYGQSLPNLVFAADDEAALYLWYADAHVAAAAAAAAAAGYHIAAQIIWVKNNAQFVTSARYKGKHEPCFYAYRKGKSARWFGPNNEVTVWECDRASSNDYHPTQKPVELAQRAIRNSSQRGQLVIDLFGGGGTTMVAAEQLGRLCRMIEISEKYCAVILERMSGLGLKPERLNNER